MYWIEVLLFVKMAKHTVKGGSFLVKEKDYGHNAIFVKGKQDGESVEVGDGEQADEGEEGVSSVGLIKDTTVKVNNVSIMGPVLSKVSAVRDVAVSFDNDGSFFVQVELDSTKKQKLSSVGDAVSGDALKVSTGTLQAFGNGIFADLGGIVKLERSNIKNFIAGLGAKGGRLS